jgi:hypothetical protein
MKTDRSIKELLELFLEHQYLFESGLCWWNSCMEQHNIITWLEYKIIKSYLNDYKLLHFDNLSELDFWWSRGHIKPRLEWLKEQIKLNS